MRAENLDTRNNCGYNILTGIMFIIDKRENTKQQEGQIALRCNNIFNFFL